MCDQCEEKSEGGEKQPEAAGRMTRRGLMAFAAGAAVGVGLGFWSCQEEPRKKLPETLGVGTTTAAATSASAKTIPADAITQPAPDLGAEVFPDIGGRAIAKSTDAPLI